MQQPFIGIDTEHQKVHEGRHYTANYLEKAVANLAFVRLRFKTNANSAHLIIAGSAEGKTYFQTYSGTTYTVNGTAPDGSKLTVFNRSIPLDGTTTTVTYAPTVNVLGTLRGNQVIFGGLGPQSTGGTSGGRIESIVPPNSDLLIVLQNVSGQPKDINLVLDWYEVVV